MPGNAVATSALLKHASLTILPIVALPLLMPLWLPLVAVAEQPSVGVTNAVNTNRVNQNAQSTHALQRRLTVNIRAQPLAQALLEFSRQSGMAILMSSQPRQPPEHVVTTLVGSMSLEEGLRRLLVGTNLTYEVVNEQSLIIVPQPKPSTSPPGIEAIQTPATKALEEITVTASKRVTSLHDTPMAVTAINNQQLLDNRVTSLFDFMSLVPSLQVARRGDHSASMLYLRGVGSDNPTEAGDSGVATHVDGIYSSRSQGTAVLLYDLAQIEVLRGPQGSLFGRNSTSGVVNYHTQKPVFEWQSKLQLTLGNYDFQAAEAMLNVPVNDHWALRLAGALKQHEGQLEFADGSVSKNSHQQYNNSDLASYRLSSTWQVNDNLSWWLSAEQFLDQGSGNLPAVDYDTPVLIDTLGWTDLTLNSFRSRLDWRAAGEIQLSYIAGYTDMERSQNWDGDGVSAVGSETDPSQYHQNNFTAWSNYQSQQHELQLKNADHARLRWLLAGFYFEEETDIRFDLEHQSPTGVNWGGAPSHSFQQPHRGSNFLAVYGQLSYDWSDQWTLSVGARSGRDRRYDRGGRNIGCPDLIRSDRQGLLGEIAVNQASAAEGQCFVVSYNDVDQHWYSTTYMARLEYRPSDAALYYLMYAEGFKPGIVEDGSGVEGVFSGADDSAFRVALANTLARNDGDVGNDPAFIEPELSRNVELGFKLLLFDNRLSLNGALFTTAYEDLQVSSVSIDDAGTEVFRSNNAASASINGLELEISWAVTPQGLLSAQFSWLDARYEDYLAVDSSFPGTGQTWNPSANDPQVPDLVDFSGNRMKQAPKYRFGLAYRHKFHLDNGSTLMPYALLTYSDEVFFSEANREKRTGWLKDNQSGQWLQDPNGAANNIDLQPAYWELDLSLRFSPAGQPWWLEGFVDNVTDATVAYDVYTPEAEQPHFYLASPRMFGLRMGASFH